MQSRTRSFSLPENSELDKYLDSLEDRSAWIRNACEEKLAKESGQPQPLEEIKSQLAEISELLKNRQVTIQAGEPDEEVSHLSGALDQILQGFD